MISQSQIVEVYLEKEEIDIIKVMSKKACLGGKSQVRQNSEERKKELEIDQFVGQLGTCAFHKYQFGHIKRYIESREIANSNPYVGDGGRDIPNANVDIKCSLFRSTRKSLLEHFLPVRPHEMHDDWIYIMGMADRFENWKNELILVYLIGWACSDMFPKNCESQGIFANTYVLQGSQLNPLPKIKWEYHKKYINKNETLTI